MKRFLFIGHAADRSGAPIVLLHFLRWVKSNRPDWQIDLLLIRAGELESDYREVAEVFVMDSGEPASVVERGWRFLSRKLAVPARPKLAPFGRRYDAVIGNTVVSLKWLEHFQRQGIPTVCWMHELAGAVATFYSDDEFSRLAGFADRFIVPSRAVEDFLRGRGIDKEMSLVYEFSAIRGSSSDIDGSYLTRHFDVPDDAFVILGSGKIERRKGVDIFVDLASRVVPENPGLFFVWVGGGVAGPEFDDTVHELPGLIFTGQLEDPHAAFASADIFALTSREDPFPLVCLEAAIMGKPIICFANAGGIPELVEQDGGAVVPFGDVVAFANQILRFYTDRSELARAGHAIKEKVETRFSLSNSCEKLSRVLDEVLVAP